MRTITALTIWLACAASPAAAERQDSPSTAAQRADDLDTMADLVLPTGALTTFLNNICVTAYETHLNGDAYQRQLELEYPGIQTAMLDAMGEHCTSAIGPALAERRIVIRTELSRNFTGSELSRLARAFAPQVEFARKATFPMRQGDTGNSAFQRSWNPTAADKRRFGEAAAPLLRSPDGTELIDRVLAYQKTVMADFESGPNGIKAIVPAAKRKAADAANAYARSKGGEDVYRWADPETPSRSSPRE